MSDVAETLDPLRLPLQGERLIEASAGTGKTFTIAALYLRLLLGLGGSAAFPRPLTVEELLVVTFTEAATAELRGRIRSNIHELRIACLRETTDNPLYERLLEEIDDKAQAAQWLLLAERNAFESGMLFEQQLIEDESLLRYQACAEFWRRHCYPLPREIALVVFETWKGPQALLRDINRYLQGEAPVIKAPPPDDETLASRHAQIVVALPRVRSPTGRIRVKHPTVSQLFPVPIKSSQHGARIVSTAHHEARSVSVQAGHSRQVTFAAVGIIVAPILYPSTRGHVNCRI